MSTKNRMGKVNGLSKEENMRRIKDKLRYSITINDLWWDIKDNQFTLDEIKEGLDKIMKDKIPPKSRYNAIHYRQNKEK